MEPVRAASDPYSHLVIVRQKSTKIAVATLLTRLSRRRQPCVMRTNQDVGHNGTRYQVTLEIDEAIKECVGNKPLMFGSHVPSAIGPFLLSRLDLHCAQPGTDIVGHDNISVGDAYRSKSRNHPSPLQLTHDVVLARSSEHSRFRNHLTASTLISPRFVATQSTVPPPRPLPPRVRRGSSSTSPPAPPRAQLPAPAVSCVVLRRTPAAVPMKPFRR
jgi:hypothetical protein